MTDELRRPDDPGSRILEVHVGQGGPGGSGQGIPINRVPAEHRRAAERLRICIERGEDRVTMVPMPAEPESVGRLEVDGLGPPTTVSVWTTPAVRVTIAGPLEEGAPFLPGDYATRFEKRVKLELQVWDQDDRTVWWHAPAALLGDSDWYAIAGRDPAE